MAIIVRKVDGVWKRFAGDPQTLTAMVDTRTVSYADGRQETEACEPYPVEVTLDPSRVTALVEAGTWTETDLGPLDLKVAIPFTPPEGKRVVGAASYAEEDGAVSEVYGVEDIPLPPSLTPAEKLRKAGLSLDEFDAIVADAIARRAAAEPTEPMA
ncbi:MAG: hypothetical protein WDM94_09160 [Bauldia sp.]